MNDYHRNKDLSKKVSEVNPVKRFGRYMLKIATFTTVLTFVGLLFLNAGWVSPEPMCNKPKHHVGTYHVYTSHHHYGHIELHYDWWRYAWH